MDGEQMHSLMGNLYASTIAEAYERNGKQTLCQSRSLGALAAPITECIELNSGEKGDLICNPKLGKWKNRYEIMGWADTSNLEFLFPTCAVSS